MTNRPYRCRTLLIDKVLVTPPLKFICLAITQFQTEMYKLLKDKKFEELLQKNVMTNHSFFLCKIKRIDCEL